MGELTVASQRREQIIDITERVQAVVTASGLTDGLCHVYVPHTTCGVIINEGADPDVAADVLRQLAELVPRVHGWAHAEGNSDSHLKAIFAGSSQLLPVAGARLRLGRWQSIFLCEFDGPRQREVWVTLR